MLYKDDQKLRRSSGNQSIQLSGKTSSFQIKSPDGAMLKSLSILGQCSSGKLGWPKCVTGWRWKRLHFQPLLILAPTAEGKRIVQQLLLGLPVGYELILANTGQVLSGNNSGISWMLIG